MDISFREAARRVAGWLTGTWRHWQDRRRLRRELATLPNLELDRLLGDAGLCRADLSTIFTGKRRSRQLMTAMMARFGIERAQVAPRYWGALNDALRICAQCKKTHRCRRWLELGRLRDVPRRFCPNAPLFTEIERAGARSDQIDAI